MMHLCDPRRAWPDGLKEMKPTVQAYSELQQAIDHFNAELFGGELPTCLVTLQRKRRTYGYFSRKQFVDSRGATTDEVAINPAFFVVVPIAEILQTVVHEQMHQWQVCFGKPSRRGYHNKEWAKEMERIGLMPSNTGKPGGKRTGQRMADYVIPGGLFEVAMKKLLGTGFGITWKDLRPDTEQLALVVAGQVPEVDPAELEQIGVNLHPEPPPVRTTRRKYTCPKCEKSVWGKPKLKVICGDCSLLFVDVEEAAMEAARPVAPPRPEFDGPTEWQLPPGERSEEDALLSVV